MPRTLSASATSIALALTLLLCACASNDASRVGDAVTSPLHDLNLVQAEIPPKLQEVETAPYAIPSDTSCAALTGRRHGASRVPEGTRGLAALRLITKPGPGHDPRYAPTV